MREREIVTPPYGYSRDQLKRAEKPDVEYEDLEITHIPEPLQQPEEEDTPEIIDDEDTDKTWPPGDSM